MNAEYLAEDKCYNLEPGKEICVITNGCPETRVDTARIEESLKQNGWIVTNDFRKADIILFNSCALTQYNQERSIEMIKTIKTKKKPHAQLIVFGCLPKINKKRLEEVYQGITFGSDEIEKLDEIFNYQKRTQNINANYLIPHTTLKKSKWTLMSFKEHGTLVTLVKLITYPFWYQTVRAIHAYHPNTFCIKVSTGCLNSCSYCAVKKSRGRLRSKPINTILKEFEEGLEKKYNDFALIGTDVGAYGIDQGSNLINLLKELLRRNGDYKIKLRNINPRYLIKMLPGFCGIFESGKIPYILSSVESGNNRILKLMKRGYCIEDFKDAIHTLNKRFPEIQIRTQIMVGFPSETEEEFQDSLRLLDEVSFDYVEAYIFQKRPGTKAAEMENQIPQKVARRRYLKLFVKSLFNQRERKKKAIKEWKENQKQYIQNP